jgi:site-specific DNA-methyltransferase (adenine-specific)
MAIIPYFKSSDKAFTLLKGDCVELLNQFDFKFNMIFADPPYFLSNDGISVQSGKMVSVNKGEWDRSNGFEKDNEFNYNWLKACREHLTDNGTIWISGTFHNIFSVAQMLTELGYKILNCITWAKTNPPPNLSCRYFTHSTEFIIWARKSKKSYHFFNYELMKSINGGSQMKDVWNLPAIAQWEKSCGKHPTQKPLALLTRIILASTKKNAWILDPFTGSSTTGIAANLLNRKFLGIDMEEEYLNISINRKLEIDNPKIVTAFRKKILGFAYENQLELILANETETEYERSLNFL